MSSSNEEPADFISKKVSYMIQAIQNALPEVVLKNFKEIVDDADRFTVVWHCPQTQDVLAFEPEYAGKDQDKARTHREKGNEYFQKKSYLTAMREYNISVINGMTAKDAAAAAASKAASTPNGTAESKLSTEEGKTSTTEGDKQAEVEKPAGEGDGTAEGAEGQKDPTAAAGEDKAKPSDKNELALAYANRSAALFHLKHYKECLRDIDLAIESEYPESMLYKLLERRGTCYRELGNRSAATESFQQALDSLANAGLSPKGLNTLTASLSKQLEGCAKIQPKTLVSSDDVEGVKIKPPTLTGGPNETHPNASVAVKIRYDISLGRHAVAAKDIKIGDVLVSESPYAAVMLPGEYSDVHCYRCFAKTEAPVPCRQCTTVIFCSRECREAAWKSYHSVECSFAELFAPTTCAKIGHLAARITMTQGISDLLTYLKTTATKPAESPEKAGFDEESGLYAAGTYHSIYNLVPNTKFRKSDDLFEFAVVACVLMKILKLAGYFGDMADTDKDFEQLGGAMLRHLQILQCNACRIVELYRPTKFDDPKPVHIGVGIYPTAALVNHSCDPNADLNFYGDAVVVRAIRNIFEGEEICVSYGPVFYEVKQRMRQTQLKGAYFFSCRCEACRESWPVVEEMFDEHPRYKCENCRAPLITEDKFERKYFTCALCKHKQDMEDVVGRLQLSYDVFARAMNTAMNGSSSVALPDFVQHLLLLHRYIRHPWRDLASCQSAIKQCYRLMANVRRTS